MTRWLARAAETAVLLLIVAGVWPLLFWLRQDPWVPDVDAEHDPGTPVD